MAIRQCVLDLAKALDGAEYGFDLIDRYIHESIVEAERMVVMWGHSDDLLEIRGVIRDEFGAYDGRTIRVTKQGILENRCSDEDCPYFHELNKKGIEITLNWNDNGNPPWTIETTIPHEKFMIYEDGEKQSEGIVFCIDDINEV